MYDEIPADMRRYLSHYGWHFNKKLYEYAVAQMRSNEGKVKPVTKEQTDELLASYGITLENNVLHDAAFVATMCKADYYGRSIPDDGHLALFVKDYIDDKDAPDGTPMARWYATMVRAGVPVDWSEVL